MAVTPRTTTIDVRAPWTTAPSMSRPRLSVPMRWARDGARRGSATVRNGSDGAITPASTADATTTAVRTRPTTPAGWRRNRRAAVRQRAGAPGSAPGPPGGSASSAVADAGIDTGVDEVGDQVGDHQREGDEQDHSEQDGVVAGLGRG